MTKTNREIVAFINSAAEWQAREKMKQEKKEPHDLDTKFGYAVNKLLKRCTKLHENYQELVEDVNLEFAAVDEKNILLRDERSGYKYTKDDQQKRITKIRALRDATQEFEPHFAPEMPNSVADSEPFIGFVIKDEPKLEVVEKAG